MDIFHLVDPSVAIISDDEHHGDDDAGSIGTTGTDSSDIPREIKRHMPNSPPRPSHSFLRKKLRQGSPHRCQSGIAAAPTDGAPSTPEPPKMPEVLVPATPSTTERLLAARDKRESLTRERAESVAEDIDRRTTAALIRAESHMQSKVLKANRCDERLRKVQEKKLFLETERRVTIETTTQQRTELALKRAETVLEERSAKARPSIERIAEVRERKYSIESERTLILKSNLAAKSKQADLRARQSLQRRQNRARHEARIARVKNRRSLQEYERRTALLSSLDHKVERASRKKTEVLNDRRAKAREEIRRAQAVARKVKAARAIQRTVKRKLLGQEQSVSSEHPQTMLSQKEAAVLIQTFPAWKNRVIASRFSKVDTEYLMPHDALKLLASITDGKNGNEKATFEELRRKMMHPTTIQASNIFLEALGQPSRLNDRTLLSAFLIATHPMEVLDDDKDRLASALAKASQVLVGAIQDFGKHLAGDDGSECTGQFTKLVTSKATAYGELFHLWKNADLAKLIRNMTKSAEQSWMAYLTSCEALSYIAEVQGGSTPDTSTDSDMDVSSHQNGHHDPLASLRLRHEASKDGSRLHIKRLRVSLNKLLGTDEGRQLVKKAKEQALRQVVEEGIVANLKAEVDDQLQYGTRSSQTNVSDVVRPSDNDEAASADGVNIGGFPDTILNNQELVHRILLTDPSDFHKLSWDGVTVEIVTVDDFMSNWIEGSADQITGSPEQQIVNNMRRAFFDDIIADAKSGNLESMKRLLLDLHGMMRKLVPNRIDLHSHLSDEAVKAGRDIGSLFHLLLIAADALANNLESPARASSTLEWIRVASGTDGKAQYGFTSKEAYTVASCAFLLSKAEACHVDVANHNLTTVAPLIHSVGSQYELQRLKDAYGLGDSPSNSALKEKLPATSSWVVGMLSSIEAQTEISRAANSSAKRYACLKSRGFVDSLLFAPNQLAIPEVYVADASKIMHIRNEARYVVIGCALGLHISNIARANPSIFASVPLSSPLLEERRQALDAALRANYSNQKEFHSTVASVVISFVLALNGEASLPLCAEKSLRNCVGAVLRGFDPVLKLLDNRVKQVMRNLCKWQPSTSVSIPMQTGRSMLQGEEGQSTARSNCTKKLFIADTMKEASKSGFSLFSDKLVEAGELAFRIVNTSITSYGDDILDRLLVDAAFGGSE